MSRQHAMVEFLNGQYYMVDMGSTNGVEYNGQRIARKRDRRGRSLPNLRPRSPLQLPLTVADFGAGERLAVRSRDDARFARRSGRVLPLAGARLGLARAALGRGRRALRRWRRGARRQGGHADPLWTAAPRAAPRVGGEGRGASDLRGALGAGLQRALADGRAARVDLRGRGRAGRVAPRRAEPPHDRRLARRASVSLLLHRAGWVERVPAARRCRDRRAGHAARAGLRGRDRPRARGVRRSLRADAARPLGADARPRAGALVPLQGRGAREGRDLDRRGLGRRRSRPRLRQALARGADLDDARALRAR